MTGDKQPPPPGLGCAERLYTALTTDGNVETIQNLAFIKELLESGDLCFDPTPIVECITSTANTSHEIALNATFRKWTSHLGAELNELAHRARGLSKAEFNIARSLAASETRNQDLRRINAELHLELKDVRKELQEANALNRQRIMTANDTGAAYIPFDSAQPNHRATCDPKPFNGSEKDVFKRQEQFTTWRARILLNFAEDSAYFSSEHRKILSILRCLGGEVYTLNQDLLDQVQKHSNDPAKWTYSTADDLLSTLTKQYETMDLAQDAAVCFDKLEQGNKPFQNFLATFITLASKCRKPEEEKVDALKRKVSIEIANMIRLLSAPPARDNFKAWADQCQVFYNNQIEFEHYQSQKYKPPKQYNGNNNSSNDSARTNQANRTRASAITPSAIFTPTVTTVPIYTHTSDLMQLDAMRTAERELCFAEGRCFYCKGVGHMSHDCDRKKAADARRALLGSGRGCRGSFFNSSRSRGGSGGAPF